MRYQRYKIIFLSNIFIRKNNKFLPFMIKKSYFTYQMIKDYVIIVHKMDLDSAFYGIILYINHYKKIIIYDRKSQIIFQ